VPLWLIEPTHLGGLYLPNANFLAIGAGVIVLIGLELFLALTRYGIIIRAGVENREMVRALGIDVGRAFTLVFVIGGAMAGLAGILYTIVFSGDLVSPNQGDSLLIFAFIVVVIGGLGSIRGSAVAALTVGLLQQYTSFYIGGHSGWAQIGDLSTVLLLAVVLELRPVDSSGESRETALTSSGPSHGGRTPRALHRAALIGLHVPWVLPGTLDIVNSTGPSRCWRCASCSRESRWATT